MPTPNRTPASSRMKMVPKEGSRKFVGPPSLRALEGRENYEYDIFESDMSDLREGVRKFRDARRTPPKNRVASLKGSQESRRKPMGALTPETFERLRGLGRERGFNSSRFEPSRSRIHGSNPLTREELIAVLNKLPTKLRQKLRDAYALGIREARAPVITMGWERARDSGMWDRHRDAKSKY